MSEETSVRKTRVLIVDDSAVVRQVLGEVLAGQPDIEVVGTAPDPYIARDKIMALKPDMLTLDIEMPRMNGISFLKRLMHYHPMPVIVISSVAHGPTATEALRLGAVRVLSKPGGAHSIGDLGSELIQAIRSARDTGTGSKVGRLELGPLIAIGASTGGVEAVNTVLSGLPANSPPVLVVQHIPKGFSAGIAEHLGRNCLLRVKEAGRVEDLVEGSVLIAPGDAHLEVRRVDDRFIAMLSDAPPDNRHRPSVNVLFHSIAKLGGKNVIAVLLTGMGADGAKGMLALRESGARTIVQDEQSSVVYGMPAEAARMGAAQTILPLKDIAGSIVGALRSGSAAPVR